MTQFARHTAMAPAVTSTADALAAEERWMLAAVVSRTIARRLQRGQVIGTDNETGQALTAKDARRRLSRATTLLRTGLL